MNTPKYLMNKYYLELSNMKIQNFMNISHLPTPNMGFWQTNTLKRFV